MKKPSINSVCRLFVICAYVIVVLARPGTEVHRVNGDTGGFDSWIMLAGASIAWRLLYERAAVKDKRDRAIDGHAIRVGDTAIVVLLIVLLLALGVGLWALGFGLCATANDATLYPSVNRQ